MDISYAQKPDWESRLMKKCNTRDVDVELGLLAAEVGEAFTAWRKGLLDLGEELADVFLYLTGCRRFRYLTGCRRRPVRR
ncbi:hypothetical protein Stsp01_12850 [Streptomyces sp. NBRC 13847]|uniref:hypothetical protein n=1 Tax=Streptomyces TaxID=1883 RepID=UPI0024A5D1FB|nr:hypothetical protein [Streptomyces sp. NBRC 13847]GLW14542.1 hypothetical protein Stsp01_12850 [Streptomyces sp. NBRC 13847]